MHLKFGGLFSARRGAIGVGIPRRAWIHRRRARCAGRNDRGGANIFGSRNALSAVGSELAQLLRLASEVHRVDPPSALCGFVAPAISYLCDLVESGLKRARDRPDDRLSNKRRLEGMAK